jgi:hypothetical protein
MVVAAATTAAEVPTESAGAEIFRLRAQPVTEDSICSPERLLVVSKCDHGTVISCEAQTSNAVFVCSLDGYPERRQLSIPRMPEGTYVEKPVRTFVYHLPSQGRRRALHRRIPQSFGDFIKSVLRSHR